MSPKLAVILYKSKVLSNGEHPLMLRVTKKGKRNYVSLGISSPANLWDDKKNLPKRTHPNREFIKAVINKKILAYQNKLLEQDQLGHSAERLIKAVEYKKASVQLFTFLDELIDRLVQSGKIGNANVYKDTRRTLKNFTTNTKLLLIDIDQRFLNKYETYLRSLGLADTSIFTYFKTIRSVFNKAIQEGLVKEQSYPFKVFKVSKFNTTTKKRAISKKDIKGLERLPIPSDSPLYIAQQYFLFSYYGQGMNFRDMAFLKWKNIVGDTVFYKRAKTGNLMQFQLLEPAQAIIEYYRPQGAYNQEDYVFPILDKHTHITPTQIDDRSDKVLKQVNKGLKELSKMAGISVNVTTYVARHTYATVLKENKVPTSVISEAMGHANPMITQTYLKSFDNEVIHEANKHLL